MAKIQKKSKQQFHLIPFFYFPPKDCPSEGQLSPLGFAACQSKKCTNRAVHAPTLQFSHRTRRTHRTFWQIRASHRLHRLTQIRRVWHPCHTHAATKLSSHRIHGTHRNDWRRRKICEFCEIRGRLFSARSFCVFCEIRGRISSARNFCEFREFCGRTCASKLGVGSVEGIRRAAWVWQGCHTLLRKLPRIARMCTD